MHVDTNRKYYNVNELLDEVQDLRDRARVIRKKRTKTRRFDFSMPFGHDGRMRVVPTQNLINVYGVSFLKVIWAPQKSTRLSKVRMQSVLVNSQASDRRAGMTDFKDQVFLQLEQFKKKYMRLVC